MCYPEFFIFTQCVLKNPCNRPVVVISLYTCPKCLTVCMLIIILPNTAYFPSRARRLGSMLLIGVWPRVGHTGTSMLEIRMNLIIKIFPINTCSSSPSPCGVASLYPKVINHSVKLRQNFCSYFLIL